jgi:hypothetical protein
MQNFKDYFHMSPNINDNFYRLKQQAILEAQLLEAKKKKEKKANKDYDGDGKVESGSEEYLGSRSNAIKKAIAAKKGKKVEENYLPKLNESKKGLPPEMLADLFVKNSTEGYEPEDAAMYTPLPPEIHRQILPHVEDEVLMIGQGGRIPEGANVQKHINDLTKAIRILDNAGHGNHPAAHFLDKIRDHLHYN